MKEINDIGKKEAEELEVYVPTLEEFKEYIKKMNRKVVIPICLSSATRSTALFTLP